MTTKLCNKCGETKNINEFYNCVQRNDKHDHLCIVCRKKYQNACYKKHKKLNTLKNNEWKNNNPEKAKKIGYRSYEKHYIKKMLENAKQRAKKAGLIFFITEHDINVPEYCPYLNIKLEIKGGNGRSGKCPSIDRINNDLGYIPENIEIISDKANKMKQDSSIEELVTFAKNVLFKFDSRH